MRKIIDHIRTTAEHLRNLAKARCDGFQREIERVLALTTQKKSLSLKDAFSYSRSILSCSLLRSETHIAALAILVISISTSIFMPYGATDIITRISLISSAMFLGTALSILTLYLLLPLHLKFNISLWPIAVVHSVIAATIFSLIEPVAMIFFAPYPIPGFLTIFTPFLLLSIIADGFVLWNFKSRVCMRTYQHLHQSDTIETMVPSQKRGEIYHISAADHYVEIFTGNGHHMHRITMKAAVEKTSPDTGLRVHRSHWVAYNAMLSMEKSGGRHILTLRSGAKVPVSPKQVPEVQNRLNAPRLRAAE